MGKTLKKKSGIKGIKIAIVAAKFNDFITKRLLEGCLKELSGCGIGRNDITIVWVPGAYEIPLVALKLANKKTVHAIICLGAVIRGETSHFDIVANGVARGITQTSLLTGKPVILGVLTTETVDQAYKRSEEKGDNKGRDAAIAALEMIKVLRQISGK